MNTFIQAEKAGGEAFRNGSISTYKGAEKAARTTYHAALERECFVAGWNQAFWDEQERVLMATQRKS